VRDGRAWPALALILFAALWLQRDALRAPFFADDYLFLDQVRQRSLPAALAAPDPLGNYFRPVSRALWFWGLTALAGESPLAFHVANLALLLAVLALLFVLARGLLGVKGAAVASGFVALHHATDVPALWVSGSQDLLAVLGALAALLLHVRGRALAAGAVLLGALLCKETVVLASLVAVALGRRVGEPWSHAARRAWPLGAALAVWILAWGATTRLRPAIGLEVRAEPAGVPAALVHLGQTALGLEWKAASAERLLDPSFVIALAAVLAAIALAGRGVVRRATERASERQHPGSLAAPGEGDGAPRARARTVRTRDALVAGSIWALLGALPVMAVAGIWSAYHYLFAICGVGLLLAAVLAGRPALWALAAVAALGASSELARRTDQFATARGPWTSRSHLNRFYLERGMQAVSGLLADLRRARPRLPRRSTLYFAGLPSQVAFQAADGPLVRWAYGDTTLRSYFLTRFAHRQARRGPLFFFSMAEGRLEEITGPDSLQSIAWSLLLSETPEAARDVLRLAVERHPADAISRYRLAWAHAASGEADAARSALARAGAADGGPASPDIVAALERVAATDTAGAIAIMSAAVLRHALDAGAHALLADLLLTRGQVEPGAVEALAARTLSPQEASMWRRWGLVQALLGRDQQAVASLERYRELGGEQAAADAEITALLRSLRRKLPGGDLAQAELRRAAGPAGRSAP
jgi:Flp pilus assembly protein TadD